MRISIALHVSRVTRTLMMTTFALTALVACGGDDSAESSGSPAASSAAAPAAAQKTVTETIKTLSADSKKCLELVRADRYVEAIDPCERAVRESGNAANIEVKQAYDEAKAEVQAASQAAALKASAEMAEGKSAEDAAKDATSDMMGKFGTQE
jgi:hypothetical protein